MGLKDEVFDFYNHDSSELLFSANIETFVELIKQYQESLNPRRPLDETEFIWCLVGNVRDSNVYGEEKKIRKGTKYFSPGTKLYCFPTPWGECFYKMQVIGLNKRTKKLTTIVMKNEQIVNFRIKKIYNRKIMKMIYEKEGWRDSDKDKSVIENIIVGLHKHRFDHQSVYPISNLKFDERKKHISFFLYNEEINYKLILEKNNIEGDITFKFPFSNEDDEKFKIIAFGQRKGLENKYYVLENINDSEYYYIPEKSLKNNFNFKTKLN